MSRFSRTVAAAAVAFVCLSLAVPEADAQDRLCDPGGEDCRQILIDLIRAENVGLDIGFWFLEDTWIAAEIIARHNAGVPVRILMDTRANGPNPKNARRLEEFKNAGIPMRERFASGILHWKAMIFAGQSLVEFSAANYSPEAWVYSGEPYTNYVDEAIYFTRKPSLVQSFMTKFDDLWTNTTSYRDYANITPPLSRVYPTYPLDPEMNFPPAESYAVRAVNEYYGETQKMDVIMYRITDRRHSDALIDLHRRGLPIRLLTEPQQYRDPNRLWHSWNVDRMYAAGIPIRHRAHQGLNHQKSVLLYGKGMTIFGSSNWTSPSAQSQEEHNYFTSDSAIFQWFVDQFERKWNNLAGVEETKPFVPLPPSTPDLPSPAYQATNVPTSGVVLQWDGGPWAHVYDVYFGTQPAALELVGENLQLGPSQWVGNLKSFALVEPLLPGTVYYWKVVGKTMANMTASSPLWTFTTEGTAPPPPVVVREPYLQQVTATSAVIVWATQASGAAEVRLTRPDGTTTTVSAASTLYPATTTGLSADYYQHVARLTGLSAATTYTYDILVNGIDVNPDADRLATAPAPGTGTATFIAFGDSGTGSTEQRQLATLMNADQFDFALHGGDLAYGSSDGTGAATHQTMDQWFFSVYRNWLRSRPMFPSMGNHDSRPPNNDGVPFKDLLVLPENGASSSYPDHAERYYSFDYGPIHVVVLDTELAFQDPARRAAQLAWLEADLAATTQPWKVAAFHRAPFSSGAENGSDFDVRAAFTPVFDRFGVQLVVSGHEHDYERTVPLRAGAPEAGGTVYIVSGGGGGPLYPAGTDWWTAYSASVHHYVKGSANECTLTVEAISISGAVIDSVSLRRCDSGDDTQPPTAAITTPVNDAVVSGMVTIGVNATDNINVAAVTLAIDGVDVSTDRTSPFGFSWNSTDVPNGTRTLQIRATDDAGNSTLSSAITVTVDNPVLGEGDILLYAADATVSGQWLRQDDGTAAGGKLLRNPNLGAAKRTAALEAPADYFELTFTAQAGTPYRLWMRARADDNHWANDSTFAQFSGSVDANGNPVWRIGTTSAADLSLEECSGCGVQGWGWQDNGWGAGVLGTPVYFAASGPQTIRIQTREDGLSIDQLMLSPVKFFNTAPGQLKNDTTIYPRSSGETPPPAEDTQAPAVSITSPAAGATVSGTSTVTVSATDNLGVTRVELVIDGVVVGTSTAAPYSFSWDTTAASNGSHTLQARAFDAALNRAASVEVTVTVDNSTPPPNTAPAVALTSPAGGATFTAPATITVAASASDSDGTIARVEFYTGTTLLASDTAAPYEFTWSDVAAGTYTLTARATDDAGLATTSAAVTVTVSAPPNAAPAVSLTSPAGGATFTAPATITLAATASDTDGSVSEVQFYSGATLLATDTAAPYEFTWTDVAAGTYTVTARATDNAGAVTTSSAVTITVSEPDSLAGWTTQDIGAVGLAGSTSASAGIFTLRASGADIWGTTDAFHFAARLVTGDVDVVARVASEEYVHAWTKAGVMVRESLTAGSAHGFMLVSPGKGLAFQRRVATSGLSTHTSGGSGTAPAWVKLERRGNTITAYRSADGVAWTLVGSDSFAMGAEVYVGLALTSKDNTRLATATFDNVTIVQPSTGPGPANVAPAVSLTSPAGGATFTAPATIAVAASASDSDGTIASVEFYNGTTLLGSDTAAPYEFSWTDVAAGTYTLTARATDNAGALTTSSAVSITVTDASSLAGWTTQDIGTVGLAGSTSASAGTFTLRASGADVWGTADAFHFAAQSVTGDVDVVARVASEEYVHAWTKAGVMIRESLTAGSAHGFMLVSPGKGLAFQRRVATSGLSTHTSGGSGTAPAWVKLERRGNTITAYRSADGVSWTLVGSDSFAMGAQVYVGLALTSKDNTRLATATFDNVTITPR